MVDRFLRWLKEDAPSGLLGFLVALLLFGLIAAFVGGC
jgi:hypothetical protein